MYGRFVIVLLVLFAVIQSFEANHKNIGITEENIVDYLKELSTKILQTLKDMEEDAESLESKTNSTFNEVRVPKLIRNLEKKIEDITEEVQISLIGAIKCLAKQQQEVQVLVDAANAGIDKCSDEVKPIKDQITQEITLITPTAQGVDYNITIGIWKCYYDNYSKPDNAFTCLLKMVVPMSVVVEDTFENMQAAKDRNHKLVEEGIQKVSECVALLKKELVQQENVILNGFRKCVI